MARTPILTSLIAHQAEQNPNEPVLHRLTNAEAGVWSPITRREFHESVMRVAVGLMQLGVGVQQCIGVLSENRPELIMTDFAAWQIRAIPVGIYSTSSTEQVAFIVKDASITTLIVGSQRHYRVARDLKVPHIVVLDPAVERDVDDRSSILFSELGKGMDPSVVAPITAEADVDDIATLVYTSGTTGEPKGAILCHSNFDTAMTIHRGRLNFLSSADSSLCFLPLSHVFEKAWSYFCIYMGMQVYVNQDPLRVQQSLRETHPTCMCSVPRFWEKVYAIVNHKIEQMNPLSRALSHRALKVGHRRNIDYRRLGKKVPALLEWEYQLFDRLIYTKLKRVIGVERGVLFPTAGAPIAQEIVDFCRSVDIRMVGGYGLSETTATVTCFPEVGYELASVGTVMPEVNMRINPTDNEIQVKGATVMKGYFNRSKETAEAFTEDGWFKTGDAGRIDENGSLYITDRLKDLFKTSNGKYVAPQAIETRLCTDPLIEQVAVIGDKRKYVSALIVPDYAALHQWAQTEGIDSTNEELAKNPRVIALITERVEALLADFAAYERVKYFTLLPKPFTMADGELTNTLKMRRKVVAERYADAINAMYPKD